MAGSGTRRYERAGGEWREADARDFARSLCSRRDHSLVSTLTIRMHSRLVLMLSRISWGRILQFRDRILAHLTSPESRRRLRLRLDRRLKQTSWRRVLLLPKRTYAFLIVPERRKRTALALGATALLTIGVLGYAALPGGSAEEATLVIASPTAQPSPSPAPTPVPPTPPPPAPTPIPPVLTDAHSMFIERIGVAAPVAVYTLDENRIPIVPTGPYAGGVVAWYDFSARPGTGGNAVYAGHVTWNGAAVFYSLTALGARRPDPREGRPRRRGGVPGDE